jgi:transglutaminase-like putative cysteine protease
MKAVNAVATGGNTQRDLSRIGIIDYLLMTFGSCLAGYSGGMAINEPTISWFVVQWILIGAATSYFIRSMALRAKFIRVDGFLYGLIVILSFAMRNDLQTIMPAGGFPFEVIAAGSLCWMLIMGSFFTWQDSTLLFQAVPSIAMFGLVGCYDTFRNVIFLFFAFLMCLATLFARAHYRQMLRQAADSGYFTRGLAPGTPVPEVETTPGLADRMREGPWRWVAGPEWALGSALVVALISLLGAPVIRQSTQGVSGFVKIAQPTGRRPRPTTALNNQSRSGETRIGQGPNRLTKEPVLEISMDQPRYLRGNSYDVYENRAWRFSGRPTFGNDNADDSNTLAYAEMLRGGAAVEKVPFHVRLRQPLRILPVPGIVVEWEWRNNSRPSAQNRADGSYELTTGFGNSEVSGEVAVVPANRKPENAQRDLEGANANMLELGGASTRVIDLARSVAGESGSDYEKAEKIRREIANRIKYNINAAATPGGRDPVDHVLFDQKEAYCDVFASAMVIMSRSVGIPARYVTGYLPSPENADAAGRYVVLESDAHAWAELFFEGVGWVVFDATVGAEAVPGGEQGASTDDRPWYQREWFRTTLDGAMVVLLGLAILFGIRAMAANRKERTPRTDLDKAYITYSRMLERATGHRRDSSRTPDEFFSDVAPQLGGARAKAEAINNRFVHAMYAPGDPSEEQVEAIRKELGDLRKELASVAKPR